MKLVVLRVGKGRTRWADEACGDYAERIARHLPIEEQVIATARTVEDESEALLANIKDRDRLVVLDPRGKQVTTEELAAAVSDATRIGTGRLVFAIGGPFGTRRRRASAHGGSSRSRVSFSTTSSRASCSTSSSTG